VVKLSFIIIVLNLASTFDLEVEQVDMKIIFLHGDLEEEIYMKHLEAFKLKERKTMCVG